LPYSFLPAYNGIPRPVDAETQSDWIDLLTHRFLPRALSARLGFDLTNNDRQLREWFHDTARTAAAGRCETFHHDALADMGLRDDQIVDIEMWLFSAFAIADSSTS